jgi:hypothetical protein
MSGKGLAACDEAAWQTAEACMAKGTVGMAAGCHALSTVTAF